MKETFVKLLIANTHSFVNGKFSHIPFSIVLISRAETFTRFMAESPRSEMVNINKHTLKEFILSEYND